MSTDTIAAIATVMTDSGIGIVRISGDESLDIADRFIKLKNHLKIMDIKSHTVNYGYVCDGDETIDEVMVLVMRAPRSYTKEDTVEIDCHGGVYVMKRILETVVKYGARPAEPGEFTKRAFLNGRIDLSQAESVIDVIHAKNEFALKSSISQLSGVFSKKIADMRKLLLHEIAFIESALDDPEHISLDGYGSSLLATVKDMENNLNILLKNSENGRLLKEGITTVIVGKPNVGKSSLLNELIGEEKAIVTDVAGTTRDVLEEQINLNGILLNIVDTAGIRDTEDVVEKIGVERAKNFTSSADLLLYVVDGSTELDDNDIEIVRLLENKKFLVLLNKSDLKQKVSEEKLNFFLREHDQNTFHDEMDYSDRIIPLSAKERTGFEQLEKAITVMFFSGEIKMNDEVFITNIRHKNSLWEAAKSLQLVLESIEKGLPEDFFSIDLMNAYEELGKILGESVEDDLVNEIFSKFCLGK